MHMAALGAVEPAAASEQERAEDYSKLPGGGEYEYTAEATYYVGPTCGRWILNEDKSFTKIPMRIDAYLHEDIPHLPRHG